MLPAKPAVKPEDEQKSFFSVRFPIDDQGMRKLKSCVFVEDSSRMNFHNDLLHIQPNNENPNCALEGWRKRLNDGTAEFRIVVKAKRQINVNEVLSVNFGRGALSEDFSLDTTPSKKRRPQGYFFI